MLRLDAGTRRSDGGRTLIGGAPLRILRLSSAGARVVGTWASGSPIGASAVRQRLARRLVTAGLAHPTFDGVASPTMQIGVVTPVRDDPDVEATVRGFGADERVVSIVVVDDGSVDAAGIARAVDDGATDVGADVRLVRRARTGGPAAARNAGWPGAEADLIAFVDANVVPQPGWLDALLPHFADPAVAAVAPRVRARPGGSGIVDRYEAARSPLDLGPAPGRVATGGRIGYVPTTTLLVRREVVEQVGGFDEDLRYGEDVDLVWRIVDAGWDVRYEPAAVVTHRNRGSWPGLIRQRYRYGTSAADLDRRHPRRVPPVAVNSWSLAAWLATAFGGRRGLAAGLVVGAGSTAALVPKLRGRVDRPVAEAVRLGGVGHLWAGTALARAGMRPWLPLLVIGSLVSPRMRRVLAVAAVGVPVADWFSQRPDLDPVRWTMARVVDDGAYAAGVWMGCLANRRVGPLLPARGNIDGL